ncbi:MAG: hypothetical protein AMXMBFR74_19320 [Parvibaculum sp.]|uniref:hypothetical protein n=1 Tax=Parvibaculum sp. TaxID=2024848 RepID=UPI0035B733AE
MRTLKKSMLVLGSAVALGSIAMVAAPAPSHAPQTVSGAARPGAAPAFAAGASAAAGQPRFSRYGKR